MTGELTSIGPVTSQPEDRKSRLAEQSGPALKRPDPLAHPERVKAVSDARKTNAAGQRPAEGGQRAADEREKPAHERVEELTQKFSEHLAKLHDEGYLRELRLDYEQLDDGDLKVKIMDARTDKVIREIPPEDQVEFAKRMEEVLGLIMDELA
jgi:flagellar protein FlaG